MKQTMRPSKPPFFHPMTHLQHQNNRLKKSLSFLKRSSLLQLQRRRSQTLPIRLKKWPKRKRLIWISGKSRMVTIMTEKEMMTRAQSL